MLELSVSESFFFILGVSEDSVPSVIFRYGEVEVELDVQGIKQVKKKNKE